MESQANIVVWCTGLSGSGKTTLCQAVARHFVRRGEPAYVLDADELRQHYCSDLGFSIEDRVENIKRITELALALSRADVIVLVAAITPLAHMRDQVKKSIPDVIDVFVDAPFDICQTRDPKGLYDRAKKGMLKQFTGADSPFERPQTPSVWCQTHRESITESAEQIINAISVRRNLRTQQQLSHDGRRRTLAVDFDGVIANYEGWRGVKELGTPRPDVIEALSSLKSEGWKIIIHTTRSSSDIEDFLRAHNVPFDEINSNCDYKTGSSKPVATVYWDDRALRYSGDARRDLQSIRSFRTWSGRS